MLARQYRSAPPAGVLIACAFLSSGCAIDPLYAQLYGSCMAHWQQQELQRDANMEIRPEGFGKSNYCEAMAREGLHQATAPH